MIRSLCRRFATTRERIAGSAVRTPLLRLAVDAPAEIYLKLESLQPIGSFKLRGAGNAIAMAPREALSRGVWTASAGNMAQGVAWNARRLGIPCTVVVPDHAPQAKLDAIERLGGRILRVPFDTWWKAIEEHGIRAWRASSFTPSPTEPSSRATERSASRSSRTCRMPTRSSSRLAAAACRAASPRRCAALRPEAKVYGCEAATAAPLSASLAAGRPVAVDYTPSFVDGIGSRGLLPEMWPLAKALIAGALVSSLDEIAAALRLIVTRARVVAEGAGAASVAPALSGRAGSGRVVCVVSGGNLDASVLATILRGETPR